MIQVIANLKCIFSGVVQVPTYSRLMALFFIERNSFDQFPKHERLEIPYAKFFQFVLSSYAKKFMLLFLFAHFLLR